MTCPPRDDAVDAGTLCSSVRYKSIIGSCESTSKIMITRRRIDLHPCGDLTAATRGVHRSPLSAMVNEIGIYERGCWRRREVEGRAGKPSAAAHGDLGREVKIRRNKYSSTEKHDTNKIAKITWEIFSYARP